MGAKGKRAKNARRAKAGLLGMAKLSKINVSEQDILVNRNELEEALADELVAGEKLSEDKKKKELKDSNAKVREYREEAAQKMSDQNQVKVTELSTSNVCEAIKEPRLRWEGDEEELQILINNMNGKLVDVHNWQLPKNKKRRIYTPWDLTHKATFYLKQPHPDFLQCGEKLWFSATHSIKRLYLTSGGFDIRNHKGLSRFCYFAIDMADITFERRNFLRIECWQKVEQLHSDGYGSTNISKAEYPEIIENIKEFINEFERMDKNYLRKAFVANYITYQVKNVEVTPCKMKVDIAGYPFYSQYKVIVK